MNHELQYVEAITDSATEDALDGLYLIDEDEYVFSTNY